MPLLNETDEKSVKQPSDYLKLDKENNLVLLSNVYSFKSHYLKSKSKSVACIGDGCIFCKQEQARSEYYYFVLLNEERGILRLPAGVFFSMNELEKVMKNGKTKRDYSWIVLKKGEGMETKYTCSKDEPIDPALKEKEDMDKNNEFLEKKMGAHEKRLEENYKEFSKPSKPDELTVNEDVNPDEIPF